MFADLGKNIILKEIAKKVAEVNPEAMLGAVLKEAHGLADELEKDLDGDGVTEMNEIKADLVVVHDKLAAIFTRLEAARASAKK